MTRFTKLKTAVVACATLLLLPACGVLPNNLLGSFPGTAEAIALNSGIDLDIFVPEGWYLKLIEEGQVDSPWHDPEYLVIDNDILPESTFDLVANDKELPGDINPITVGRAFSVTFLPYQPCTQAAETMADMREWVAETEGGNASPSRGGVGKDGFVATHREGSGWRVYYRSSLIAGNENCQILQLEGVTSDEDPAPLADLIADVAENSALG